MKLKKDDILIDVLKSGNIRGHHFDFALKFKSGEIIMFGSPDEYLTIANVAYYKNLIGKKAEEILPNLKVNTLWEWVKYKLFR